MITISDSESSDDDLVRPRPTILAPTPAAAPSTCKHSDEGSDSSDDDFVRDRFHSGSRPGNLVRDFARDRLRVGARPDPIAGNVWRDADPLCSGDGSTSVGGTHEFLTAVLPAALDTVDAHRVTVGT